MHPDDAGHRDKGHRRQNHETVVLIAPVVETLRHDGITEEGTRAQQLAEEGYDDQYEAIAYAVTHSVEERLPRAVAEGKGFETPP